MLNDSTVLVTGGTGSFGHAFAEYVLQRFERVKLIVCSRDEMKQWDMAETFRNEKRIRFFIGDVRDRERLYRAVDDVDYVVHAAATKIVPTAEYNPFEAVKTNVNGAMNVIDACIDRGVKRVVALSTDKASSPINLYGATKLASDKMFVSANSYTGWRDSRFAVVRYGNVMGSRGSVIPFFLSQKEQGQPLRITDERMTRFMISLQEGVELVLQALESTLGGEIFVKKIPSMGIMDIAEALDPGGKREIVGIRPGEKLHEQMISSEDSYTTRDYGDHFRIFPNLDGLGYKAQDNESGTAVTAGFTYSSDTNAEQMTVDALSAWVESNRQLVGRI